MFPMTMTTATEELRRWQKPTEDAFAFFISFYPTAPMFGVDYRFAAYTKVDGGAKPLTPVAPPKAKPIKAKAPAPVKAVTKAVAEVADKPAVKAAAPKPVAVAAAPASSAPVKPTAEKPATAKPTPVKAAPAKTAPAKTAPAKTAPTKAAAPKEAPATVEPMAKVAAAPASKPASKPASAQAPAQAQAPSPAPSSAPAPTAEAAPAPKTDATPKMLMAKAPAKPDDLKLIKGIGPALEKQLNGLGIHTFAQIAKMTKKDLTWVDDNLKAFKGRCFRDDWVGQAKAHLA
ncbi:MAG: hypothetical protein AAF899_04430 [Pseudomonadota bacterium]